MLKLERHRELQRRLAERGSILVSEEARALHVSEETIRRDIKALAAQGIVDPTFGGAVLHLGHPEPRNIRPPVDERGQEQGSAKAAIGAVAAQRLKSGQSLIIDAGTTTLAFARQLRRFRQLTIITNSLPVAQVCAEVPESTVIVIGGKLVPASLSLIGPQAQRDLSQVSVDWAFLGAAAIDEESFTSADPYEAEVKRAMIAAARRAIVLADATKFGSRRFAAFARAGDVDELITSSGAPREARARLEAGGTRVVASDVTEETSE